MSERPLLRGPERPEWLYNPEFAMHTASDNGFSVGRVNTLADDSVWDYPATRIAGYDIEQKPVLDHEVLDQSEAITIGEIAYDTYIDTDNPFLEDAQFLAEQFLNYDCQTLIADAQDELGTITLTDDAGIRVIPEAPFRVGFLDTESIENELAWMLQQAIAYGYVSGRLDQINDMRANGNPRTVKADQLEGVVGMAMGGALFNNVLIDVFTLAEHIASYRGSLKKQDDQPKQIHSAA